LPPMEGMELVHAARKSASANSTRAGRSSAWPCNGSARARRSAARRSVNRSPISAKPRRLDGPGLAQSKPDTSSTPEGACALTRARVSDAISGELLHEDSFARECASSVTHALLSPSAPPPSPSHQRVSRWRRGSFGRRSDRGGNPCRCRWCRDRWAGATADPSRFRSVRHARSRGG
jgi:hypothetical protein